MRAVDLIARKRDGEELPADEGHGVWPQPRHQGIAEKQKATAAAR